MGGKEGAVAALDTKEAHEAKVSACLAKRRGKCDVCEQDLDFVTNADWYEHFMFQDPEAHAPAILPFAHQCCGPIRDLRSSMIDAIEDKNRRLAVLEREAFRTSRPWLERARRGFWLLREKLARAIAGRG